MIITTNSIQVGIACTGAVGAGGAGVGGSSTITSGGVIVIFGAGGAGAISTGGVALASSIVKLRISDHGLCTGPSALTFQ